ncbi:hypothetical protein J6590_028278 [Homalodisca vitripennis]|nr:hypothetical protein J6590_028278 [Homalodisca vitripennis]
MPSSRGSVPQRESILEGINNVPLPERRNIVAENIREDPRGDDVSSPMKMRESPGDVISSPWYLRLIHIYLKP